MIIAQISDTHIKEPGVNLFGKVDVIAHMDAIVARIEALDPKPDLVIHSGDLTNDGEPTAYRVVTETLSRLSMPLLPSLGNHDLRAPAQAAYAELSYVPDSGPFRYVYDAGSVRIIVLDSLVEGAVYGELGAEQLAWLDAQLSADADTPALIAVHHQPFATGVVYLDAIGLKDSASLEEVVRRHRQVERVLSGHVHRLMQARFGGTVAMTTPGAAHQVSIDLRPEPEGGWTREPPGFLLHCQLSQGFTTHLMPVEDHPFYPVDENHDPLVA